MVSVSAPDSGSSVRLKPMFRTIERRAATALIALTMVVVKSWNGTTAQARLSPGASPGRSSTSVTSDQVDAHQRERVGDPLDSRHLPVRI